jgi:hypothetical protein
MRGEGNASHVHMAGTFNAANALLDYVVNQGGVNMTMQSVYSGLSGAIDSDELSEASIPLMMSGERSGSLKVSMESASSTIDMTQPSLSLLVKSTMGAGTVNYGLQDGIVVVDGSGKDVNYDIQMKDMPMPPFQVSVDEAVSAFSMPLRQSEEALPANLKLTFDGLKASDTIWGMIDPTGSLPRDKALLNIDLSAKMKWLVDVMALAENKENPMALGMPVAVNEVTINDISLEVAGAKLNATGGATIDNTKMPPMPVGEVNLDLQGGMGLIDKLVALGFVPPQQAMMVKGMAGMFTVPGGNGTDHLKSKIEMQEGGAILANGNRIK